MLEEAANAFAAASLEASEKAIAPDPPMPRPRTSAEISPNDIDPDAIRLLSLESEELDPVLIVAADPTPLERANAEALSSFREAADPRPRDFTMPALDPVWIEALAPIERSRASCADALKMIELEALSLESRLIETLKPL
jgi:hypothetical protein